MLRSNVGSRSIRRSFSACLLLGATLLALSATALGRSSHPKTARLASGYYQCYLTTKDVSPINQEVSYGTVFESSFTLNSKHRYDVSFLYSGGAGPGHIVITGHHVRFVGGAWNSGARFYHLTGIVYPAGVTMPHSQLSASKRYKLVLRGARNDSDTAPPTSEFTGAVPRSFWYCNKR
jgi:hypothetical protein